jgi:hypothetical protein
VVGHAKEEKVALVGDGEAALAQTCRDGRPDTARADHLDCFEHL